MRSPKRGGYTLTPDSAESLYYEFNYFPAKLYVKVPLGISNMEVANVYGDESVYSLTGVRVAKGVDALRRLPAGVYLYKGKKIVVK